VEELGVGECGRERGQERERFDGGGVGAGVAMDAGGVGAGADGGELDSAVVRAIGRVGFEDVVDGREEGSVAGVERVVEVRGDGAVEAHEVDGIKGGAQDDVGDGEETGLRIKWKWRPESFLPYMARWKTHTVLSGSPASRGAQT